MNPTVNLHAELDELEEDLHWLYESFAELDAEYRGEVTRYGDAWPGAALQVSGQRAVLRDVEARADHLRSVLGRGLPHGPWTYQRTYDPISDEPF